MSILMDTRSEGAKVLFLYPVMLLTCCQLTLFATTCSSSCCFFCASYISSLRLVAPTKFRMSLFIYLSSYYFQNGLYVTFELVL